MLGIGDFDHAAVSELLADASKPFQGILASAFKGTRTGAWLPGTRAKERDSGVAKAHCHLTQLILAFRRTRTRYQNRTARTATGYSPIAEM
jgi:hypothetical protein